MSMIVPKTGKDAENAPEVRLRQPNRHVDVALNHIRKRRDVLMVRVSAMLVEVRKLERAMMVVEKP